MVSHMTHISIVKYINFNATKLNFILEKHAKLHLYTSVLTALVNIHFTDFVTFMGAN